MSLGSGGNLYEALLEGLAASPGAGGGALPRARPSASVVPWRRTSGGGIEVYWVKRGEALPFMGGWHAFPGGGLARSDADLPVLTPATTPSTPSAPAAGEKEPDLAPGILACALRELFEETGILLARSAADAAPNTAPA